jgi:SAM-dependent methyltransferase
MFEAEAMTGGVEAEVVGHYSGRDLFERLAAAIGKDEAAIQAADIAAHDEFHVGSGPATERFLDPLGLPPETKVLDIGCGIGGPARRMASRYGWSVTALDLTPDFIRTAERLSEIAGDRQTRFVVGSASDLPFESGSFDLATLLHVGMNLPDKPRLFAEAARVLRSGGRFAVYDIMRTGPGHPDFPVPWAEREAGSYLAEPAAYREAAEAAGLALERETDRSEEARAFFADMQEAIRSGEARGGPPVVMGENAREKVGNLVAALRAGDIAPIEMVFRKQD